MQKKWREKECCRIKSDVFLAFILAAFINFFFYHHLFSDPESSYPSDEVDVTCKRALCECDSQATKCFANSTFNAANIDYDTSKCWCINNEWKMVRYLNKKKVPYQRKILFYLRELKNNIENWNFIPKALSLPNPPFPPDYVEQTTLTPFLSNRCLNSLRVIILLKVR